MQSGLLQCALKVYFHCFQQQVRTIRKPTPKRVAILAGALVLLIGSSTAFAEFQYERAFKGKTLVEGLGFEGALTVFDDTPRMFRRLGHPNTLARFPLWYFYDAGQYKVTVNAEYVAGRFQVRSIQYSGDRRRRFVTNQGIRLGDSVQKIIDVYGEPDTKAVVNSVQKVKGRTLSYKARGIAFNVGKVSRVIAINVFRPERLQVESVEAAAPKKGAGIVDTDAPIHLIKPDLERLLKLEDLGLSLQLPEEWTPVVPLTESGGSYAEKAGRLSLNISVCKACGKSILEKVTEFEKQRPSNRVPENLRWLVEDLAAVRNAERVYMGLYMDTGDNRPTWLVALQKGRKVVLVALSVKSKKPLVSSLQRNVISFLKGVKLIP
ncbi:MAG TPA: hypothetical protein EYN66_00375 [Myxococcales bacterium]|nr:hypothetical protein [Myxococcales bacterium]